MAPNRAILDRETTVVSADPMAIAGEVRSRARPLAYFLKNRMYLGEINHGQTSYNGEHGWWR
jgi:hypothetical protein